MKKGGAVYADVLDVALKRKGWRPATGQWTKTRELAESMRGFYEDFIPDDDLTQLRLTVTFEKVKTPAPRFILQSAFYFGISFEKLLSKPKKKNGVVEIRRGLEKGESQRAIARRLGIDPGTVRRWGRIYGLVPESPTHPRNMV